MAIYGIAGTQLTSAFSKNGESLLAAFNLNGQEIFRAGEPPEPSPDYSQYVLRNMWPASPKQGMAVYGDIMFQWNPNTSNVELCGLYDGTSISTVSTGLSSHGNDITFTDSFYDENDEFPILCINTFDFFRISRNSATHLMKIKFQTDGHDMGYGCVFDGDTMYALGYANGYTYSEGNYIRIMKLDLSDLTDNGDGTYTPAILDTIDREWLPCIQGADFHDGMIWIACGMSYPANVYALNPATGAVAVDIDLVNSGELEGLAWAYNSIDNWFAVYGQKGYGYRKILFTYS